MFDHDGNRSVVTDSLAAYPSTYASDTTHSDEYTGVSVNSVVTAITYATSTDPTYNLNIGALTVYGNWDYRYDADGHLTHATNPVSGAELDYRTTR